MSFLLEFWSFLRVRKRFWLLPILLVILLVGVMLVWVGSSPIAPFIYTLF
jgi:hypothetical protein